MGKIALFFRESSITGGPSAVPAYHYRYKQIRAIRGLHENVALLSHSYHKDKLE